MLLLYLQESDPQALRRLEALCRDNGDADWETRVGGSACMPEQLLEQVVQEDAPAAFFLDGGENGGLEAAVRQIRKWNDLHYLVLTLQSAADALQVRPPYFRPTGFLLRPVEPDALHRLLDSIYRDFIDSGEDLGALFSVRMRGTVYPLPYRKILCFESSGKKILARTAAQEYEFYGSLEEIGKGAPDYFLRIHKSFCVNLEQIREVRLKERTVTLSDESVLPFSRTLKPELLKTLSERQPVGC